LALALAATAPRHVCALVLVAPAAGLPPIRVADRVLASPILGPAVACFGFRCAALAMRIGPLRTAIATKIIATDDVEHVTRQLADGRAWRTFVTKHRRLVTYARCLHRGLSRLDCPLFIVSGDRRPKGYLVPIDDAQAVTATILRASQVSHHQPFAHPRPPAMERSPS
jgi:pimeloyl-ACP methyl ester carboxylesterase